LQYIVDARIRFAGSDSGVDIPIPAAITALPFREEPMRPFVLFMMLLYGTAVHADTLDIVLGTVGPSPTAGETIQLPLYVHNNGASPRSVTLDANLECRLISEGDVADVIAWRVGTDRTDTYTIKANGFLKASYAIRLPEAISGNVQLIIPSLADTTVFFPVAAAPEKEEGDQPAWIPRTTDEPMDALIQLYQPYVKNISFYEPMYFLVGTEPKYSKFQISLKYRFFNPEKEIVRRYPWLHGFHFGYSQTSFWNLDSDSAPFEDTSYKPELFYISDRLDTNLLSLDGLFIKAGLRHESNGRGGEFSRGTNTAYIEPILLFYNEDNRTGLKITPRIWAYFRNENENNPDIDAYRGHFNLGITLGKADSWVMDTNMGVASEGGSVQVDITYPLSNIIFNPLDVYVQAQYVNQLAESLLDYTERTEAFRLGFAIVR
jgi:phospholipase A1